MIELLPDTNDALIAYLKAKGVTASLVVADPNWPFHQTGGGDPKKFRSTAKREYSEGDYGDIAHTLMLASRIVEEHAVLALHMPPSQKTDVFRRVLGPLEDWGSWRYHATVYWRKLGAPGIGQWVRNDVEEVLILSRSGRLPPHLRGQIAKRTDKAAPKVPCFRNWLEATADLNMESNPRKDGLEHSEKPEEIERKIIGRFCPPFGLVLSLWSGMFPTGRACKALGLDCYGTELDPGRHAMALERLG